MLLMKLYMYLNKSELFDRYTPSGINHKVFLCLYRYFSAKEMM